MCKLCKLDPCQSDLRNAQRNTVTVVSLGSQITYLNLVPIPGSDGT